MQRHLPVRHAHGAQYKVVVVTLMICRMYIIMGEFAIAPITGSVSWTGDSEPTTQDLATELGKVYQVWNRVRENDSKTWVSDTLIVKAACGVPGEATTITVLVEPEYAQVHILCPTALGGHHVLGPGVGGELDSARARVCVGAVDDGDVCLKCLGRLCRAILSSDVQLARNLVPCAYAILKSLDQSDSPVSVASVETDDYE